MGNANFIQWLYQGWVISSSGCVRDGQYQYQGQAMQPHPVAVSGVGNIIQWLYQGWAISVSGAGNATSTSGCIQGWVISSSGCIRDGQYQYQGQAMQPHSVTVSGVGNIIQWLYQGWAISVSGAGNATSSSGCIRGG